MIRLISTDFDGTVVNHQTPIPVSEDFLSVLAAMRADGVKWAINTGRALAHLVEGLAQFPFPQPDFLLTMEREVFRPDGRGGWEDFGGWNADCNRIHDELYALARPAFEEVRRMVEEETTGTFLDDERGVGFVTATERELEGILSRVNALIKDVPRLHYQRNMMYLRFCHTDYSKGAALGELARLLGLDRSQVFAAGDHMNDIPMLDGRFAQWMACPSNSAPVIKQLVTREGGYVARRECGDGVAEALRFFEKKLR